MISWIRDMIRPVRSAGTKVLFLWIQVTEPLRWGEEGIESIEEEFRSKALMLVVVLQELK